MVYRALWERKHISYWHIRVAPERLPSHNACYIMFTSSYDLNYLVSLHNEAEIGKRSS